MSTELEKRVKTGVIGGAALLLVLIFGGWFGIFVVTSVVSLMMAHEYSLIVFGLGDQQEKRYALLCATLFSGFLMAIAPRVEFELLLLSFMGFFIYFLMTAQRHSGEQLKSHFIELALSILGLIYVAFVPSYLIKIHQSANGVQWTIVFLLIVFGGDSAAYFGGLKYGKTKLYPEISPKKTVEGGLAGLGAGYVAVLLAKLTFFKAMPWFVLIMCPLMVGFFAQVGDFCESFLKRAFQVKDSGGTLPGHGGFLDRFDGVVFGLPVMYACVHLFGAN
jgi:phosphatidate cytidylyltransferase